MTATTIYISYGCLLIALAAHMFSHNEYGHGTKDQGPRSCGPGPGGPRSPGPISIIAQHMCNKGNQSTMNRQSKGSQQAIHDSEGMTCSISSSQYSLFELISLPWMKVRCVFRHDTLFTTTATTFVNNAFIFDNIIGTSIGY